LTSLRDKSGRRRRSYRLHQRPHGELEITVACMYLSGHAIKQYYPQTQRFSVPILRKIVSCKHGKFTLLRCGRMITHCKPLSLSELNVHINTAGSVSCPLQVVMAPAMNASWNYPTEKLGNLSATKIRFPVSVFLARGHRGM